MATKEQKDLIQKATKALGMNIVSTLLTQKERQEVQTIFGQLIIEYETMVDEAECIPNLCPMGCDCGDLCPTICPNFKDLEEEEDEE